MTSGSRPAVEARRRRRTEPDGNGRFFALLAVIRKISYPEYINWSAARSDDAMARSSSMVRSCWRDRPKSRSCSESAMSRMSRGRRNTGEDASRTLSPRQWPCVPSTSAGPIPSASGRWSNRGIAAASGRRPDRDRAGARDRPPESSIRKRPLVPRSSPQNRLELGSWNSETIGYNESVRSGQASITLPPRSIISHKNGSPRRATTRQEINRETGGALRRECLDVLMISEFKSSRAARGPRVDHGVGRDRSAGRDWPSILSG
jgi:hypothetical protein